MLKNPATKYRPFAPISLSDRTWPNKTITHPPIWLSTDLRDGNQALIEPMNIQRKLRLFELLVSIGCKEIEVAFPSASQTEFDFVRYLIEQELIPDDVTIQVLTPAREELIRRTFAALKGAKRAIVHLYNATSVVFRRIVFGLDRLGTINLAVSAAKLFTELAAEQPDINWQFQYSPEIFTATELDFAQEICNAVLDVVNALGLDVQIHHYEERSRNGGSNADAIAYVEIAGDLFQGLLHGVGIHSNIVTASILAILSAVNRALLRVNTETQAEILKLYL